MYKKLITSSILLMLMIGLLTCGGASGSASYNVRVEVTIESTGNAEVDAWINRVKWYLTIVKNYATYLDEALVCLGNQVGMTAAEINQALNDPEPPAEEKSIQEQIKEAFMEKFGDVELTVEINVNAEAVASISNEGASAEAEVMAEAEVTIAGAPMEEGTSEGETEEHPLVPCIKMTLERGQTIISVTPILVQRGAELIAEGADLVADIDPMNYELIGKIDEIKIYLEGAQNAIQKAAESAGILVDAFISLAQAGDA